MKTSCGNPKRKSSSRDITPSYQPPKYAALIPTSVPTTVVIKVATIAIASDVRSPSTTIENRSRPVSGSTPNQ